MNIILTDDVVGLGDIGQTVRVKPGYARNFLIPRGLAIEAGSRSAAVVGHKMRQIEKKKKLMKEGANALAEKLRNVGLQLELRVGSHGKVFGSITSRDIADKLKAEGYDIERRRVLLGDPIKKLGVHFVNVKLHADVKGQVKVEIVQRAATREEEEREAKLALASFESKVAEKKAKRAGDADEAGDDATESAGSEGTDESAE